MKNFIILVMLLVGSIDIRPSDTQGDDPKIPAFFRYLYTTPQGKKIVATTPIEEYPRSSLVKFKGLAKLLDAYTLANPLLEKPLCITLPKGCFPSDCKYLLKSEKVDWKRSEWWYKVMKYFRVHDSFEFTVPEILFPFTIRAFLALGCMNDKDKAVMLIEYNPELKLIIENFLVLINSLDSSGPLEAEIQFGVRTLLKTEDFMGMLGNDEAELLVSGIKKRSRYWRRGCCFSSKLRDFVEEYLYNECSRYTGVGKPFGFTKKHLRLFPLVPQGPGKRPQPGYFPILLQDDVTSRWEEKGKSIFVGSSFGWTSIDTKIRVFHMMPFIEKLYLNDNNIRDLKKGMFQDLSRLKVLHLGRNQIESIEPGTFDELKALTHLSLSENPGLKKTPKEILEENPGLPQDCTIML